jgi:hypothetical protein
LCRVKLVLCHRLRFSSRSMGSYIRHPLLRTALRAWGRFGEDLKIAVFNNRKNRTFSMKMCTHIFISVKIETM